MRAEEYIGRNIKVKTKTNKVPHKIYGVVETTCQFFRNDRKTEEYIGRNTVLKATIKR